MSIFLKKRIKRDKKPLADDRIANNIAGKIIFWQRNWADWMQLRSERLSRHSKLAVLFISGAAGMSISLLILLHAVFSREVTSLNFGKGDNHLPQISASPKIRELEDRYQQMRRQKLHLDSLARSPGNRGDRDSLIRDQDPQQR